MNGPSVEASGQHKGPTEGQSFKRCLNYNEFFTKFSAKRLRDEDMDYKNSSYIETPAEEEEEDWSEPSWMDHQILSISNELSNFQFRHKSCPDWSLVEDCSTLPTVVPIDRSETDRLLVFPPEVGKTFFSYTLEQLVSADKRMAVFVGRNPSVNDNREVVIKFGIERAFHSLMKEKRNYFKLNSLKCQSIPKLLDDFQWTQYLENCSLRWCFLVFEKFGSNLVQLMNTYALPVIQPMERVFEFAVKMISAVETIHEKGFIHRSLKPNHFICDCGTTPTPTPNLKLIGLSASKSYLETKSDGTVEHMSEERDWRKVPNGDPNFHSIGYHKGWRRSRRDDMESLGYCIVYIAKGSLPWIRTESRTQVRSYTQKAITRIGNRMQETSLKELCFGLPQNIVHYFDVIEKYEFNAKPNYEELKQLFIQ